MKAKGRFWLKLWDLASEPDSQNRTELRINGEVAWPYGGASQRPQVGDTVELDIPSGVLTITITLPEWGFAGDGAGFVGDGEWDGVFAGLEGGMSGIAEFGIDSPEWAVEIETSISPQIKSLPHYRMVRAMADAVLVAGTAPSMTPEEKRKLYRDCWEHVCMLRDEYVGAIPAKGEYRY